jgi:hypothetical protein
MMKPSAALLRKFSRPDAHLPEGNYIVKLSESNGFEIATLVEEPRRWVWMHLGWDCGTECQPTDVVLEQIFVDEKTGILTHKPVSWIFRAAASV